MCDPTVSYLHLPHGSLFPQKYMYPATEYSCSETILGMTTNNSFVDLQDVDLSGILCVLCDKNIQRSGVGWFTKKQSLCASVPTLVSHFVKVLVDACSVGCLRLEGNRGRFAKV